MKKIAVFPGSFDPITVGHEYIVNKASELFDEVYVALGTNTSKKYMFSKDQRMNWLKDVFKNNDSIHVIEYSGLTVDLCKKLEARYLLRGVRNTIDFEYERSIAQMNSKLNPDVETIVLFTKEEYSAISSSIVREIFKNDGDISEFVPKTVDINA